MGKLEVVVAENPHSSDEPAVLNVVGSKWKHVKRLRNHARVRVYSIIGTACGRFQDDPDNLHGLFAYNKASGYFLTTGDGFDLSETSLIVPVLIQVSDFAAISCLPALFYVYRSDETGCLFARPRREFTPDRFRRVEKEATPKPPKEN